MQPMKAGPLTNILVVVNLLIAAAFAFADKVWEKFVIAGGLFPIRFIDNRPAAFGNEFLLPVFLTPLSAAFLHGGLVHAVMNMLMLLLIGRIVEPVLGWPRMLLLYVIGAYAAAAVEFIAHPHSMGPVVGASGALSAVIAAYAMLFPNKQPVNWGPLHAKYARPLHLLLGWVGLNLMLGFAGPGIGMNIAIWSHIGGFIAGLLLAWPLLRWKYRKA
jgi:membrane associated rhomboid family serine protease